MRLLARYIDANASAMSREDAEEETWSKGLEEVEPERSLMSWLQEMVELVSGSGHDGNRTLIVMESG